MNPDHPRDDNISDRAGLPEDQQLLKKVAAGDESAFSDLYQRYHVPIYNYLLRLVNEPAIAEELLQEVFVAVWKGAGRFRGQAQVRTWAFRIAHHQAVSWLRRRRDVAPLVDEIGAPGQGRSPEAQAIDAWRADQVQIALTHLSPKHRAVVELAFVYAFSYAEIAEIMACPVGTVKSRMSFALRYLTGALLRLGVEEE